MSPDVASGSLVVAVWISLAAGAVSFASPCVLPLVPGYLGFVSGLSGADMAEGGGRVRVPWSPGPACSSWALRCSSP